MKFCEFPLWTFYIHDFYFPETGRQSLRILANSQGYREGGGLPKCHFFPFVKPYFAILDFWDTKLIFQIENIIFSFDKKIYMTTFQIYLNNTYLWWNGWGGKIDGWSKADRTFAGSSPDAHGIKLIAQMSCWNMRVCTFVCVYCHSNNMWLSKEGGSG